MTDRKRAAPVWGKLQKRVTGDLVGSRLLIEYQDYYEEDYQIIMLRNNLLPHILQMEVDGIGNVSRFTYHISGMCSMKADCEQKKLSFQDLKLFLEQFLETVEEMKSYMLCPDCLWLEPDCIYRKEQVYRFCYFPAIRTPLQKQFHELTDYWLHKIDYQDIECVFLAHKLNRETLEEQFDIQTLLEEYGREADERRKLEKEKEDDKKRKQEMLFAEESTKAPAHKIQEKGFQEKTNIRRKRAGAFSKVTAYVKRPWGQWEDLLSESREM